MPAARGAFSLVLHAHLPYVIGHGTWPHGVDMLYEAAAESYMPLLECFETAVEQGCSPKVSLGITPVLAEQLADGRFQRGFAEYLQMKCHYARENTGEFGFHNRDHLKWLAEQWEAHYGRLAERFDQRYGRDLIGAFRRLQDEGHLEIMCSAATHAYLPLLLEEQSIQAQIEQGVRTHERLFGRRPRGFWLPECAYRPAGPWRAPQQVTGEPWDERYRPGLEEHLGLRGIDYFIVDTHMLGGTPEPVPVYVQWHDTLGKLWGKISRLREPVHYNGQRSPYSPYFVGHGSESHPAVAAFVRDPRTGLQVWSGEWGYPGDGWYLDFHKKHFPGGLRYWRVTDSLKDLGTKMEYEPHMAQERIGENADHFLSLVHQTLADGARADGLMPVLCAPFDTELFGHWWFEGPRWLDAIFERLAKDPTVRAMTCGEYLAQNSPTSAVSLPEGSWGAGGHHWVWLNEWTEWTWRRVYDAEQDMLDLVRTHWANASEELRPLIRQAVRELFLLQASDWQFLITTWSARDYAEARLHGHHNDFKRVADLARRYVRGEWIHDEEWSYLGHLQDRDRIFADIEPAWFGVVEHAAS